MTVEIMRNLNLQNVMRKTPTLLQMVDTSSVKPEGIIEDSIITIDSWEHPADFLILHTKTNTGGYLVILV